jgi:hypothetical protein
MKLRAVLIAVAITVATIIVVDVSVQRMTMNTVPKQTIRRIVSAPWNIDALGIGNSLMAAGFDPGTVERNSREVGRHWVAVNGGLGASGVIEHLALTRLALQHHVVHTVIYGFFDQQMSSGGVDKNSDLIGNRAILYYLEPELTLEYARFDWRDRISFEVCRYSPLLRERGSLWAKIEKFRRTMGSLGLRAQETDQFGQKTDFALLESSDYKSFARECERVIQSGQFLSAPVQALLQQARDNGARVIVVEMPMHPSHLKRFYDQRIWEEFRSDTRLAVGENGATYLNASAWIPDAGLFSDNLHLSQEGAQRFSQMLTKYLMKLPE